MVELDAAIVAGRGLLAAVQEGLREIGAEAADRDDGGAAGDALRGEAGQAGDRFGDRGVGKAADILGRDRLDDLVAVTLLADRALQSGAEAGDEISSSPPPAGLAVVSSVVSPVWVAGWVATGIVLREGRRGAQRERGGLKFDKHAPLFSDAHKMQEHGGSPDDCILLIESHDTRGWTSVFDRLVHRVNTATVHPRGYASDVSLARRRTWQRCRWSRTPGGRA